MRSVLIQVAYSKEFYERCRANGTDPESAFRNLAIGWLHLGNSIAVLLEAEAGAVDYNNALDDLRRIRDSVDTDIQAYIPAEGEEKDSRVSKERAKCIEKRLGKL